MRQLTIRNVPNEIAERLTKLSEEKGRSVNATVLEILARSVGVDGRRARLERYVTWDDDDLNAFNAALAAQRVIDDRLWR